MIHTKFMLFMLLIDKYTSDVIIIKNIHRVLFIDPENIKWWINLKIFQILKNNLNFYCINHHYASHISKDSKICDSKIQYKKNEDEFYLILEILQNTN